MSTKLDQLKMKHPDYGETIHQLRLIESAYLAVENKITLYDEHMRTVLTQRVGMVLRALHTLKGTGLEPLFEITRDMYQKYLKKYAKILFQHSDQEDLQYLCTVQCAYALREVSDERAAQYLNLSEDILSQTNQELPEQLRKLRNACDV